MMNAKCSIGAALGSAATAGQPRPRQTAQRALSRMSFTVQASAATDVTSLRGVQHIKWDPSKDGSADDRANIVQKLQSLNLGKQKEVLPACIVLAPGFYPAHYHTISDTMDAAVAGSATYTVDGQEYHMETGDLINLPAGAGHAIDVPEGGFTFAGVIYDYSEGVVIENADDGMQQISADTQFTDGPPNEEVLAGVAMEPLGVPL